DMAEKLIKVAALRELRQAPVLTPPDGLYDEFSARFPYEETEDPETSIEAVLDDLASGRPMDRLICGDVGFGKTEVALRAAFIAAMAGYQVAVVTPTTLLSRQHFRTFTDRFAGLPIRLRQLSRLVGAREAAEVREELKTGRVDIVVGTHALLAKSVAFADLGLLIVDEEQHFGVAQKERLKELRADVHVLTLTATPIPRTLQLALSGVREMSLIATPPIDRLAVRTFVLPYDPVVVREAILREHYRGGQTFYVCPRIEDLDKVAERLRKLVPEIKIVTAHGRMAPSHLEKAMTAFYDRTYDLLLSTNIIESGLDIPTANTLIVERADRLGLAQAYQIRGRVGRSRERAFAYLLYPSAEALTEEAAARLSTLVDHTELGSGFKIAMRDLDIRGAGDLLGDEQSGHVAAVGFELYCQMIDEAVAETAARRDAEEGAEEAEPLRFDVPVDAFLPASYVPFEAAKIDIHRRVVAARAPGELRAIRDELDDRFGPPPREAENLLALQRARIELRLAGARSVELRGGRLSVVGVDLDSDGSGALAERVEGALYEWREKTASMRVPEEPEARLAAVLALAEGLREAGRSPMIEKDMLPAS
ncbi:MAG TPA: DEAD/DEAH box helicase, partial [Solirubrobacterales bacterium]|nr:DEAD/DEAH box helicase [Solirubrobacterales bacterium]